MQAVAYPPPPGTDSRASTVISSIPSSLALDDGGILNGMNDLEEIGLSDDDLERGRPHARISNRSSLPTAIRELTHAPHKRPQPPALQTSLPAEHLVAPTASKSGKKTVQRAPSRGPSPAPPATNGIAPSGGQQNGYRLPRVSPAGPKRMSWQRKTSEQLEEEYDSDDEVPPDAIFYNVPLSPRSSKIYSTTPSPDRENGDKHEATNGGSTPPEQRPIPISVNGTMVEDGRSKSWNDAMSQLGEEAQELSEALERHADSELEKSDDKSQQRRSNPPAPQPEKKKSPTPSINLSELPPLQLVNGIDPMPMSKEKEAVVSRTRPSWLPPKSKSEEKKHLKEYQRMMRRSQEAERKRVQKERQEQEAKERIHQEVTNEWETKIIPNWNRVCRAPATRELWWKGVTPKCRGQVWSMAFGNHLAVSAETFNLALKRGKEVEAGVKKSPTMYSARERETFTSIRRDVEATFPELKIFQERGPLHQSLIDVLMAYSMYRNDVGYVYGTHTLAATLLLNQSPPQAFITLANMLNRPLPLAFFTQDEGAIGRSYNLFLKALQYKLPSLYRHIHHNLRIDPSQYLEPMFLTLFTLRCPVDIISRIWDIYAFEGDSFLVRTAVGIMTVLESKLYGSADEVLGVLGWGSEVLDLGKEDEFMNIVRAAGREDPERSRAEQE